MLRPLLPLAALCALPFVQACSVEASQSAQDERMAPVERAVAVLQPVGDSGVSGEVRFVREGESVRMTGRIEGLEPGEHGFHVHEYGDLTDQGEGKSAGSHFAPQDSPHGRPSDSADQRHVGDLGNVTANAEGVARFELTDEHLALEGRHSILGRALVVHAEPDDFGQPTGNAGGRVAFGVVGRASPESGAGQ